MRDYIMIFDVSFEIFDVDSNISVIFDVISFISTSGIASLYNLSTRSSILSTFSIRLLTAPYNVYLICVVFILNNSSILLLEEIPNISNLILTFYTIPISTC